MSAAGLRVAVITTEQRADANRLWHAAAGHCRELLVLGPRDGAAEPHEGLLALSSIGHAARRTLRYLRGLGPALARFAPDLVHVNNELWGLDVQRLATRGRRAAIAVHGAENQFARTGPVGVARSAVVRRVLAAIDGYASWNSAGALWVAETAPDLPRTVLPAIIPPAEFRPASWHPPTDGPFRVLVAGRLEPQKGLPTVIDAIAGTDRPDAFELHVCGSGRSADAFARRAAERGVSSVQYGYLPTRGLATVMGRMHCLVQPSITTSTWSEQFGRTVAEAMTLGLPCLVSTSGELPRLVDDPEAVFAEHDAGTLARRLQHWHDQPCALLAASRRQSERARSAWSPDAAAATVLDFWDRVRRHRVEARP